MPKCNKCGLEISFKKTDGGKWQPTNPDGSAHWELCKKANPPAFRMIIGKTMSAKKPLVHVYCPAPPFVT